MKGQKTGGRKAGTPNKTSSEVQKRLLKLLDDNIDDLDDDIKSLTPKERATLLINLAKHVTPSAFSPANMTIEQLQEAYEYFKNQGNENQEADNR